MELTRLKYNSKAQLYGNDRADTELSKKNKKELVEGIPPLSDITMGTFCHMNATVYYYCFIITMLKQADAI